MYNIYRGIAFPNCKIHSIIQSVNPFVRQSIRMLNGHIIIRYAHHSPIQLVLIELDFVHGLWFTGPSWRSFNVVLFLIWIQIDLIWFNLNMQNSKRAHRWLCFDFLVSLLCDFFFVCLGFASRAPVTRAKANSHRSKQTKNNISKNINKLYVHIHIFIVVHLQGNYSLRFNQWKALRKLKFMYLIKKGVSVSCDLTANWKLTIYYKSNFYYQFHWNHKMISVAKRLAIDQRLTCHKYVWKNYIIKKKFIYIRIALLYNYLAITQLKYKQVAIFYSIMKLHNTSRLICFNEILCKG